VLLLEEPLAAGRECGGPPSELVEFEQAGLVRVKQPGALALIRVDGRVQPLELCGDELVLVGCAGNHRALGSDQLLGVKQRLADLFEDVPIELVGADVALRTAAVI